MPVGPDVTRAGNVRDSRHGVDASGRPIAHPANAHHEEIPFTKNTMGYTDCPTCDKPDIYNSESDDVVGCLGCGSEEMSHEDFEQTLESQGHSNFTRGVPSSENVQDHSAINNREWAGLMQLPYPPEGEEMFDPRRDK